MTTEKARQSAKEKAVLLALRHRMALIRRNLNIYGMKISGSTEFICKGKSYDTLWHAALTNLCKKFK